MSSPAPERYDGVKERKAGEDRFIADLQKWDGKPIKAYIHAHGAPTSVMRIDATDTAYVWDERSEEWNCKTSVFVHPNGLIYDWRWKGNNCRLQK